MSKPAAADHFVSASARIPLKDYPEDCPPVAVRWHYAVDVSKFSLRGVLLGIEADAYANFKCRIQNANLSKI